MGRVRLGLIGMGMIGKLHAETMSKMKDLEFVAASDVDPKHQRYIWAESFPPEDPHPSQRPG